MDWIDPAEFDVEAMPADVRDLCEALAGAATPAEVAARLIPGWGGGSVYIPALREMRRATLARRACGLFDREARNGRGNAGEVCRALGVTRRHLTALLKG